MTTVQAHILNVDETICKNIETFSDDRGLLSQNLLSQLRNLIEGAAVYLNTNSYDAEFTYDAIKNGLAFIKSRGQLKFLSKFYELIEISSSHYTLDGDTSERLMLKYYEYLYRTRTLLKNKGNIVVLNNLEKFPVNLDPSLREYHEKISAKIQSAPSNTQENIHGRYYIHKTRPFFLSGNVYYEVTFYPAVNRINKFDRIIAFTDIDMTDEYAAMLTLQRDSIEVLGQKMPIMIIRKWEVSIRPCEFDNFARLFEIYISTNVKSKEYKYLMRGLTIGAGSLLDLMYASNENYNKAKSEATEGVKAKIFSVLDKARKIIQSSSPGHNIIRYLMLRMNNQIIKSQYWHEACNLLSGMQYELWLYSI